MRDVLKAAGRPVYGGGRGMSIIVLPETLEAWKEERKYGIGASDAGAMLGMSNWKSNEDLWLEKTGLREPEDISGKPFVQYGHDAEPHLRALFSLDHPEMEVTYDSPYKIIRNSEYPFIFCTPDGELTERETGRHGGMEIKTTEIKNPGQWDHWNGRIPDQYYCQVIWQMIAAGWEFVWLLAQIKWTDREGNHRKDTREYLIEREEVLDDIQSTKAEGIRFWRSVEAKKRPNLKLPEI